MPEMWTYGDPIEQTPGFRMLKDGEIIPVDSECYMNGVWEPVGPMAPGAPYMEATEARVSTEYHFPMRVKLTSTPAPLDPKTKYLRDIYPVDAEVHEDAQGRKYVKIDVYSVLRAFGVDHPTGHAIKKLLCAGMRGKGDRVQDLTEAKVAIDRAIQEAGI